MSAHPPAGYVPCPIGCGRYMHKETRAVCWGCTLPGSSRSSFIRPDWTPPVPKPSALRTWLRAERARENTEDLDAGIFEPYPTETSGVYRRDWLGAPLGPRSMVGTPIILVTKVSTTWRDDAAAVLAAADRGEPIAPMVLAVYEKFMAEVFPVVVPWTEADDVGSVTAYATPQREYSRMRCPHPDCHLKGSITCEQFVHNRRNNQWISVARNDPGT